MGDLKTFRRSLVCLLSTGFFLAACERSQGSENTGLYSENKKKKSAILSVCWKTIDAADDKLRELITSKVFPQYNQRTPLKFTVTSAPCSGGEDVAFDLVKSNTGRCAKAGVLGTATSRTVDLCLAEIRRTYGEPGQEGDFESAVVFSSLHEIGHIAGLGHEHIREDMSAAHEECRAYFDAHYGNWRAVFARERAGMIAVGDYDPNSIMNYCYQLRRPMRHVDQVVLSPGDIATLNVMYAQAVPAQAASAQTASVEPNQGQVPPDQTAQTSQAPWGRPEPKEQQQSASAVSSAGEPVPNSPTENKADADTIYCNMSLLQRCVVEFGGGAGCLNVTRSQRECTTQPEAGRVSIAMNNVSKCMLENDSSATKWTCVPGGSGP
jgi:hypothetical protein